MDVHGDFVTKHFLDAEITHFITSIATRLVPKAFFPGFGGGAEKGPRNDLRKARIGGVYSHYCNKLNKTNMLSAKTSRELRNSGICDPSINTSTRYKSLFQIPTSMSESSPRIIVLPSLVYPYFKLGLRQDEMRKVLLIRQVTE